ncbi:polysaccharide deacetylase family protein [Iningainema tapete]|uniref:Polysaccharide deacetylase family protein n=1 Tax=Iningainema tapete BLCC-T55 TaxID=2748662 RepID=A0A8J6XXE4_9CYAN|nr:polysaccharide deacetylase family protein [Iningainema tapete]MBD2778162.1 polysaccharide deacetylase family protein [Iningainema tapete BLCC-T55]
MKGIGLRRFARNIRGRLAPGGLILMYHRVIKAESDPWSICVSPKHFAEQMFVLRSWGNVIPLKQFNQTVRQGKVPYGKVAITFDDGYTDNLYNAKPILERYEISATMFLTSGYMEQKRELWWDELERLLLTPVSLPSILSLEIGGKVHHWELGLAAHYSEEQRKQDCAWKASVAEPPTKRHALLIELYQLLKQESREMRQQVMDELLTWADCVPQLSARHRLMNKEEVSIVAKSELIEIGAHSVSHPFLSFLPIDKQWQEIRDCKTPLEEIVAQPVESFAYPHGNYSNQTAALVQQAGFTSACTTEPRSVRKSNCFELPRIQVEDWDGEEFAKQLSKWKIS